MNPNHTVQEIASLLSEAGSVAHGDGKSKMRHIRPWQLFQHLPPSPADHSVRYHIPDMAGRDSLTIFSLETLLLIAAARITSSASILEIGTSWGYNALHLADNLPSALITTVDVSQKMHYVWEGEAGAACADRINPVVCDSRTLPELSRDFIFIDGDHSRELVTADSAYAFRNARNLIAWHDYSDLQPGVRDYLNELSLTRELIHVEDSWLVFWFRDGLDGLDGLL